jgi:hypothetical protein
MHDHGFYDSHSKMWFCTFFMTLDEWLVTHDYMPSYKEENKPFNDSSDST